jgi:uncharacterized protein YgiM (DUF1202 family)
MYIACSPDKKVNVRTKPSIDSSIIGYFGISESVTIDDIKGEWSHCIDLSFEASEGWIYSSYLTESTITIEDRRGIILGEGRVAKRDSIGGNRIGWINPGDSITIKAYTDEWVITPAGFISREYVDISDLESDSDLDLSVENDL